MRTEPPSPLSSALARLRAQAGRARRWLSALGTPARVALMTAGLAGLGAVGYLATIDDPSDRAWTWIFEGRKLSADDVAAIGDVLDAEGIPHASDPAGRVGVKPDRKAEALAALAKRKVGPRSLDELNKEAGADDSWIATAADRERRDHFRLVQGLKLQIEALDPAIASADVRVHRGRARRDLYAPSTASAFIYVQTEGGRRLGHRVVEGIETFLTGAVPELRPESITVADQTGHKYLAAGNPSLKEQNQTHAQEEDWRDRIAEGLRHIPGVGVSVLLEPAPPPAPAPEPPPPPAADEVRPNGRVVVEPEPAIVPPAPPASAPPRTRANVWVRVPRSFYLLAFQAQSSNRSPMPEDFKLMQVTTEKLVHDAVEATIPRDELGEVKVDTVQDDLASIRPLLIPSAPEPRRAWIWPTLYGAAGLAGAAAVAGAWLRMAARRPAARPSRSAWRPGFVADGPGGPTPGPSERVRDLIRTSPEAAAGVLQRWIGQGGALG